MNIEKATLASLVPDPDNTRLHPEENIQAIQDSLGKFGQVLPLVVHAESRIVVGGNGTVRAMKRLGWEEADVTYYDGSMDEARALSIALNRTGELAVWDEQALGDSLVALNDIGFTHEALGFSTAALDQMFPAPPAPASNAEGGDSPGLGNPIVRYDFIFDDEDQQKRFFAFLKWLKTQHEGETSAARLDAHIAQVFNPPGAE